MTLAQDISGTARAAGPGVSPVLISGRWITSASDESFVAVNPATCEPVGDQFPVSNWTDIDAALSSAAKAAIAIRQVEDSHRLIGRFFEQFASEIQARATDLAAIAESETGLPAAVRFVSIEIPRTVRQLRLAAAAAWDRSWLRPTIDTQNDIRSCFAPIGPVFVIGPNNFPFAFNGISGGDFAAALVAGNPVIAKGHPFHPNTTRELGQIAATCALSAGLPDGMIQLLYHVRPEDGVRLIEDRRLKAVAFTGSRHVGLNLKAAADRAGKLFFGELSSLNPVVVLPGALVESSDEVADQFATSILAGSGQFCTKPGLLVLMAGALSDSLVQRIATRLNNAPAGVLLSASGARSLESSISTLIEGGAVRLTESVSRNKSGCRVANTLLKIDGAAFLEHPETFQTEAFGSASLVVVVEDALQLCAVIDKLEGNLTGSIYSSAKTTDDESLYQLVASRLRGRVGRLLNDKMPTGVAVSPAMNHGGPFPASTQPHFTAVGLPQSVQRFTQLECYDKVRQHRLPVCLRDQFPERELWRLIDGVWTQT